MANMSCFVTFFADVIELRWEWDAPGNKTPIPCNTTLRSMHVWLPPPAPGAPRPQRVAASLEDGLRINTHPEDTPSAAFF
jgi:hypothetical protein